MKKIALFLFLITTSFSFAQHTSNSIFNYAKSSDDLLVQNSLKLSLNLNSFKLDDFKQKTGSLSRSLKKSYDKQLPLDNMPIFAPKGKFLLEIYDVEHNIDFKLRIFDLEKSGYFWKNVG